MKRMTIGSLMGWRSACGTVCVMVALSTMVISPNAQADVVTNTTTRDAFIIAGGTYYNDNFGGEVSIYAGEVLNYPARSLIGFDLSGLARRYKSIASITLRLYKKSDQAAALNGGGLNNEVYEISAANGDWPEGGGGSWGGVDATWNNKDANGGPLPWAGSAGLSTAGTDYRTNLLASLTFTTAPAADSAVDFTFTGTSAELTALVDRWATNMPGLLLTTSTTFPAQDFERMLWHSGEETVSGTQAYAPKLIIEYAPQRIEAVTLGATRDADIYEVSSWRSDNRGGVTSMRVGWWWDYRVNTLIGFDVSSLARQYDTIKYIALRLYFTPTAYPSTGINNEVYEISAANGDWPEGAEINGFGVDATWLRKDYDAAILWAGSEGLSAPVTDYRTNLLSSRWFTSAPTNNAPVDFVFAGSSSELTALMDRWVTNMPGLLLKTSTPKAMDVHSMLWHSSEETTSGSGLYTPKLIVEYVIPPSGTMIILR